MIVSAGHNETFPFAVPVGVGLIESAIHLTRSVMLHPPEFLLFVGSAGSYGRYGILDIVEAKAASQIEISYLEKKSYTPLKENVIVSDGVVSRETFEGKNRSDERPIIVNSSNYITTDPEAAKGFLKLGIELENMEFYSVMQVAKAFDIPCGGIFVVTNFCYPAAHDDFVAYHDDAMQRLVQYLKERIPRLETFNT